MPPIKCNNGKWKIGVSGRCIYSTLKAAMAAYRGYLASKRRK